MRDIVRDAGISLGTINYHFGSKLGLAYDVFERVAWQACEEGTWPTTRSKLLRATGRCRSTQYFARCSGPIWKVTRTAGNS
jgi:AcrR family transcriptional regulator